MFTSPTSSMIQISASVLVTVICLAGAAPPIEDMSLINKCAKLQGIPDPNVISSQLMTSKGIPDESVRCFLQCLMTELKVFKGDMLDTDGVSVQTQRLLEVAKSQGKTVDENQLKSTLLACGNQDGDGKCMKTYKMWACMNKSAQEIIDLNG